MCLRGTDQRSADLDYFDLRRADLVSADLRNAYLEDATFIDADCRWAEFRPAGSDGASFAGADLRFASPDGLDGRIDFTGAKLGRTVFTECDLTGAIGLETCRHDGPSPMDTATLFKSRRALSEKFLRDVGVPETLITYLPSLSADPIQFYTCFLSYSSRDEAFARRLHADLREHGVWCWFAPHDLAIGDRIRDTIDDAIRVYDKLPVFRAERAWVRTLHRTRHIGDFTGWKEHDAYEAAFGRLLRDLRAIG